MSELLARAASCFKNGYELMGSRWQNTEAEVIATQTICACAKNLSERGEAISWMGAGLRAGRAMCGTNNAHGLSLLVKDDMLTYEKYDGELKPSDPDRIATEDGKFLVLRCSDELLRYVIDYCTPAKAA